jgi:tryptophan-rich sensory protein
MMRASVDRPVWITCSLAAVALVLVLGLGWPALLVLLAFAAYLAWWERRKQLAVASGRFAYVHRERFGLREVRACSCCDDQFGQEV